MTPFAWMVALAILAAWFACAVPLATIIARLLGGEPPMPPPDPADDAAFDKHVEQTLAMIRDLPLYDALAALQAIDLDREWAELDEAVNGGAA